jgi:zinc transporter ZupT
VLAVACVFALLLLVDRSLLHRGKHILIALLLATAIHSFLDGWSIRALWTGTLDRFAVAIGLGLHKVPEGIAVGWASRRSLGRAAQSLVAASAVEMLTPVGAWAEPHAQRTGFATFGFWWGAFVLAIAGGTFLFLGTHAVLEERRNRPAWLTFFLTFFVAGAVSLAAPEV